MKTFIRNYKFATIIQRLTYILFLASILTSCMSTASIRQIGRINIISNRNFDRSANYQVLSTYSGGSTSELENTTAGSVEDAINQTVRKVPGGEFLMNAKIFIVNDKYFAVEGDVWGIPSQAGFRGFKMGDKVTWKAYNRFNTGTISALKGDISCLVKSDDADGKIVELSYDEIIKVEKEPISADGESLSGGKQQSAGNCFIATACYGDYNAHEVQILRQYRDSVLLKNDFGKCVVDVYYLISPPLAKLLEKSERGKAIVRKNLLGPIIEQVQRK